MPAARDVIQPENPLSTADTLPRRVGPSGRSGVRPAKKTLSISCSSEAQSGRTAQTSSPTCHNDKNCKVSGGKLGDIACIRRR